MEKKTNKAKVLTTFLSGRFSSATERKLQDWIVEEENTPEVENASLHYWEELDVAPDRSLEKHWKRVAERTERGQERRGVVPLRRRLLRVAAIVLPLLLIGGGLSFYHWQANAMQEVRVAYGERQHLFLPDSSEVWVNAGSVLRFPKKFTSDKRPVSLEGEAFFAVRHDASRPFEVQTRHLSVNVLGTRFNVKDYAGEEVATTVLESGKVAVRGGARSSKILLPNQQFSYYTTSAAIEVTDVLSQETKAWTTGRLVFRDASLKEILQTIERKFGIGIEADASLLQSPEEYTVKFIQGESVETVLGVLGDMGGFSFSGRNDKIILKRTER